MRESKEELEKCFKGMDGTEWRKLMYSIKQHPRHEQRQVFDFWKKSYQKMAKRNNPKKYYGGITWPKKNGKS